MNKRIFINIIIVVLLVGGVVLGIFAVQQMTNYLSQAQEDLGKPLGVVSRSLGPDQAVVSWNTNEEVISLILYGTTPTALDNTQTELSSVKTHRVTITGLEPGQTYFYKIQVGQDIFDNNGQPWQFSTSKVDSPPRLTEKEFRNAYGTSDLRFDLNKDGVVNGFDYQLYLEQK